MSSFSWSFTTEGWLRLGTPSIDVKDMLEGESVLGLIYGTNLFVGLEPPESDNIPANVVTIFDTPGMPPDLTLDNLSNYGYPSVQIRIRNTSYSEGFVVAYDIKSALHGRGPETWNAALYTVIRCVGEPFFLGWTEKRRAWWVVNFDLQRR